MTLTCHIGHQILNKLIQIVRAVDIHSVHILCSSGHAFDMMLLGVSGRSTTGNVNQRLTNVFVFFKMKMKERWQLKKRFWPLALFFRRLPRAVRRSSWRRSSYSYLRSLAYRDYSYHSLQINNSEWTFVTGKLYSWDCVYVPLCAAHPCGHCEHEVCRYEEFQLITYQWKLLEKLGFFSD